MFHTVNSVIVRTNEGARTPGAPPSCYATGISTSVGDTRNIKGNNNSIILEKEMSSVREYVFCFCFVPLIRSPTYHQVYVAHTAQPNIQM